MLDHVAIQVKNLKKSIDWYQTTFGFVTEYADETWAMLRRGKFKLALSLNDEHPPHIAFRVDSINDFPEGEIKYHRDGTAYLYQKDPDENIIEYICYPPVDMSEEWECIYPP